jgi:hypothetical protein
VGLWKGQEFRSQEPEVRRQKSGARSQKSGVRSQEAEVRSENEEHLLPAFCFLPSAFCLLHMREAGWRGVFGMPAQDKLSPATMKEKTSDFKK